MNLPDVINGSFELFGAFAALLNVRRLIKDKSVKGVDWRVTAFWVCWGLYNLYYYPHLGQWASFYGGVTVVLANTAWTVLALIYVYFNEAVYIPNLDLPRHGDVREAVSRGLMSRRAARNEVLRRDARNRDDLHNN